MSTSSSIAAPELVTSDFSAAQDASIPDAFTVVGRVVFWNATPSFGKSALFWKLAWTSSPASS